MNEFRVLSVFIFMVVISSVLYIGVSAMAFDINTDDVEFDVEVTDEEISNNVESDYSVDYINNNAIKVDGVLTGSAGAEVFVQEYEKNDGKLSIVVDTDPSDNITHTALVKIDYVIEMEGDFEDIDEVTIEHVQ